MQILTGPSDVIWAVDRVGESGVAALTDKGVFIWETGQTDNPTFLPAVNEGRVHSDLRASPDGEWLASHGNGDLRCWQRKKSGWEQTFELRELDVCAIGFAGPGVIEIVALKDRKGGGVDVHFVRRRLGSRTAKSETVCVIPAPEGIEHAADLARFHYYCVDYSPRGRTFLFSPTDRYQHLWNTKDANPLGSIKMRSICNEAALSPDGTIAAIDAGTTVYLHRTTNQEPIGTWKVKHCYSPKLAWSPSGRRLLRADASTTVRQYDLASGTEVAALGLKRHRATAVRFSPDGMTYLVGTFKGPVVVWDAE
jgi:WD40 repeat protein